MASRIPKLTYPGHPILEVSTLLAPPPPPPPPPFSSGSEPRNRPSYDPYRSQPLHPYRFNDDSQQLPRFPGIGERNAEYSNLVSMPSSGFKRPLQSSSVGPPKKIKHDDSTLVNQEPVLQIPVSISKNESKSSVSNGAEVSNTPRRGQVINEVFQNLKNPSLPKELTNLFGALKCDLCEISVNSTVQAKMHYIGKQHEKKVNAYLIKWCKETGEPMPVISKMGQSTLKRATNPEDLFCKICNLALTSIQHAQQHYMGRNHQRVLNGHTPLKAGYFNKETGKWQRVPHSEKVDPSGRFGIGTGFLLTNSDPLGLLEPEASTSETESSETLVSKSTSKNRRFFCELCQVATTSQDQLDMHLKGAKHRKAEKLNATSRNNIPKPPQPTIPVATTPSDSILASVIRNNKTDKNKSGIKDYSIFRTPSGQFYCQPCNLTLNSESQFSQHCESKKHKLAILKKPMNKGVIRNNISTK